MVVFTNRQLGPSVELLVSKRIAAGMLSATATAARTIADARWERELVRWLESRAMRPPEAIDVSDLAWTPEHFDAQRRFLIEALARAARGVAHPEALERWRQMIEAHPRASVQVGRRWQWDASI